MSFDIFYQTSRLSEQTVEAINPFTGKVMQKPVGETVTPDEREALIQLLSTRGANAEEMGGYLVDFADGAGLELQFDGLADEAEFSGGMASLRGLTPELASLLYDLADTGNLVMLPAMEESRPLVTSDETAARVASRWPDALVISSPEELEAFLGQGLAGWEACRDRVMGDSSAE